MKKRLRRLASLLLAASMGIAASIATTPGTALADELSKLVETLEGELPAAARGLSKIKSRATESLRSFKGDAAAVSMPTFNESTIDLSPFGGPKVNVAEAQRKLDELKKAVGK